ncbi:MAG: hypothetical protein RLZ25_1110 [Pseudomonadota bacterium]
MKQSFFALIKYCYIVIPLNEWQRFRLKCLIFKLLAPLVSGSAGSRFLDEQLRLSRLPHGNRQEASYSGGLRPRILLIDSCTPTPDRDSGSMDVFNSIRIFIGMGYRVTFIPESNLLPLGPYTTALERLGVECLSHREIASVQDYLRKAGDQLDVVMLFRAPVAIRHLSAVRRYCPAAKLIFSTIDLHFLREARSRNGHDDLDRSRMTLLHRAELRCMQEADHSIVISEAELVVIQRELPGVPVSVVPLVREFQAASTEGFQERSGLAFVGNYQHPPNIDAVLFFLKDVWPIIHNRLPEARFFVVGSYMPDAIREAMTEGVELLGFVDSLDDLFGRIRLSIAPLRIGAGLKGKVATSLGYGVPIVMTSIAAEGMGLQNEEDALIADNPTAFAEAVIRLYSDAVLWDRLSMQGAKVARRLFSIDVSEAVYSSIFRQLGLSVTGGHKPPESDLSPENK